MKFFKRPFSIILISMLLIVLTACGNSDVSNDEATQSSETTETEETQITDSDTNSIVIYFSFVGNSELPADVEAVSSASLVQDGDTIKGNAQLIAEYIADETGSDLFEITTVEPYPADYDATVDQAQEEQNANARPALKNELNGLEQFQIIYLVFPNWWGDLPMPVYTFLENNDLSGKTINVFVTHEGSGFSDTIESIQNLEPNATVVEGLDIRGSSVQDEEDSIRQWIKEH